MEHDEVREHGLEENQVNDDEEHALGGNQVNDNEEHALEENLVNDDEEGIGEFDDGWILPEIRLAGDAALPDPIVVNLGNPANPIEIGDLPVHGFEYEEILRTCPPLQEEED